MESKLTERHLKTLEMISMNRAKMLEQMSNVLLKGLEEASVEE